MLVYLPFNHLIAAASPRIFYCRVLQYRCYHSFLWSYAVTISPWQESGDISSFVTIELITGM